MRYIKSQMKQLVKEHKELQNRLKELMKEHELEKNFALKALYHSEVLKAGNISSITKRLTCLKGRSFLSRLNGR